MKNCSYITLGLMVVFFTNFTTHGADVSEEAKLAGGSSAEDSDTLYQEGLRWIAGNNATPDYLKARACFESAIKLGNSKAKGAWGFMLLQGLGVPKDEIAARSLIHEAAEAGVASAQVNLASMLAKGQGCPQDVVAAISWYEKAAVQDSLDARMRLADLYYFGSDGITKDQNSVFDLEIANESSKLDSLKWR